MLMEGGMMDQRDYRTYVELFANMSNFMRKPNLIVFLEVTPQQSCDRIAERFFPLSIFAFFFNFFRNRNMEKSIPVDYLTNLAKAYDAFIKDISKVIPVIKVDWNEFKTPEVFFLFSLIS